MIKWILRVLCSACGRLCGNCGRGLSGICLCNSREAVSRLNSDRCGTVCDGLGADSLSHSFGICVRLFQGCLCVCLSILLWVEVLRMLLRLVVSYPLFLVTVQTSSTFVQPNCTHKTKSCQSTEMQCFVTWNWIGVFETRDVGIKLKI
jgi:hypothetical protein